MNKVGIFKVVMIGSALLSGVQRVGRRIRPKGVNCTPAIAPPVMVTKVRATASAAKSLPAKPADHTNGAVMNQLNDKFLMEVIAKGGGAVGKSNFMPAWGGALNEKQIRDLVVFIRTLAVPPYKGEAPASK